MGRFLMNFKMFIKGQLAKIEQRRAINQLLARASEPNFAEWQRSLANPTQFYEDCVRFFYKSLPEIFRAHRRYFSAARRGFGEDAFHTMWFLLFERFQFKNFLEIGVYRGQTLSLVALLQQQNSLTEAEVWGISPFSSVGDSVSKYRKNVDYLSDTKLNFEHFGLKMPNLLKAYSTDPAALQLIQSRQWDAIYIDGNHDYEVAKSDWEASAKNIRPGGVIVLDDASLNTSFAPPCYATKGHPGPSRLAGEIDPAKFEEILRVGHNRVFQKK